MILRKLKISLLVAGTLFSAFVNLVQAQEGSELAETYIAEAEEMPVLLRQHGDGAAPDRARPPARSA